MADTNKNINGKELMQLVLAALMNGIVSVAKYIWRGITKTASAIKGVVQGIIAGIHTLLHDHTARVKLGKSIADTTLKMVLGAIIGVVWLRAVDLDGVNQTGREVETVVEEIATVTAEPTEEQLAEVQTIVDRAHEETLNRQAEEIAKVLYGIRKNSERDLRAVCWVLFNRVESPIYPDTLEEVIAQPSQWVCYYETNPATKDLTALALQELKNWENGENRPISDDVLWFDWSTSSITFKTEF